MAYVMLGRSQRLEDIHIVGELDGTAINCNYEALEESERLDKLFEDSQQAEIDKKANHWKISYHNVSSPGLNAKHEDVSNDNALNDSDILGLGETHLH